MGRSGGRRLPTKHPINITLCMHMQLHASVSIRKHRNTGGIIKCAPLGAHCQQCANSEGAQERLWHRKDFPHWRKAFYFSHSDSLWMRGIILSTQGTGCQNTVNYYPIIICFPVDFQDFHVLVLLLNWKEERPTHNRNWLYKR